MLASVAAGTLGEISMGGFTLAAVWLGVEAQAQSMLPVMPATFSRLYAPPTAICGVRVSMFPAPTILGMFARLYVTVMVPSALLMVTLLTYLVGGKARAPAAATSPATAWELKASLIATLGEFASCNPSDTRALTT